MSSFKTSSLLKKELPRERLAAHGAEVLRDAELLAIFLRTGRVGRNVLEVAEDLIMEWGSLRRLAGCSIEELSQISGIGPAKAAELKAAFEMGQRMARPEKERLQIKDGNDIYEAMRSRLELLPHETLWVLLLDARSQLLEEREVSRGTLTQSLSHPREVFHLAVLKRAYSIVVVHNHPSGDPLPSASDEHLTTTLMESGKILKIPLLDHVIIGTKVGKRKPYFSFRDAGLI